MKDALFRLVCYVYTSSKLTHAERGIICKVAFVVSTYSFLVDPGHKAVSTFSSDRSGLYGNQFGSCFGSVFRHQFGVLPPKNRKVFRSIDNIAAEVGVIYGARRAIHRDVKGSCLFFYVEGLPFTFYLNLNRLL